RGSGAFCPAAERRRFPLARALPRPAAAEKEGSPSPIPPQSRKIARNRTTLGRKWEEISRITADTARFFCYNKENHSGKGRDPMADTVRTINSLMAYLRDRKNIDIRGSSHKRKLRNMGYYHGYKGYRFA